MKFASRYTLKDLRELNRLSLRQVSRKTKLSSERITELEQDSSFITIEEMYRLSEIYGLSVKYIF
ncbi:helix-turn-helix domain-containing protein [Lactococcus lactis]|nr:helix-turn-helix domain-containing protein [Lactococcus lactis]